MANKLLIFTAAIIILSCAIQEVLCQGVWVTDTSTNFVPRYYAASAVVDNKIYMIGGNEAPNIPIQIFDPWVHTWDTPSFSGDVRSTEQSVACIVNGKIYVVGGW